MGLISRIRAALGAATPPLAEPEAPTTPPAEPGGYYDQAFELATDGIEWSPEAREAVRATLTEVIDQGEWQAHRALAEVWPEGFRWPAVELYCYDLEIEPTTRQMMVLLRRQVSRAAHQLERLEQMRSVAEHAIASGSDHVLVASTGELGGVSMCGMRHRDRRDLPYLLDGGMTPCLVFGCDCGWAVTRPQHIR